MKRFEKILQCHSSKMDKIIVINKALYHAKIKLIRNMIKMVVFFCVWIRA